MKFNDAVKFDSKMKNWILGLILVFIAYIQFEYFNAFPYIALALALIFYSSVIVKQKNIAIQNEKTIWDKIIDWHYKIVVWFLILSPVLGFVYATMLASPSKGEAGFGSGLLLFAPLMYGWLVGLPVWLLSLGVFTLIRKAKNKN